MPMALKPNSQAKKNKKDAYLSTLEQKNLLKIFGAICEEKYKHDWNAKKSEVAPKIKGDVLRIGLKIDEETVRSLMSKALTVLDNAKAEARESGKRASAKPNSA